VSASAFIVHVSEAEQLVGRLRLKYDATAALGVPAHITILFPFMSPERITPNVVHAVADAFAIVRSFEFTLNEVRRWPKTTYLAPEPKQPFIQLTRAVTAKFPKYPPYAGEHLEIVPHLTVALGDVHVAVTSESELRAALLRSGPIRAFCRAVELIENSSGTWRTMHVIALQGGDA
jgi:2'-5' RNA ligase